MFFSPRYEGRKALVVGINGYQFVRKLRYASNDADGVAEILRSTFGFTEPDIVVLKDSEATKEAILRALHSFGGDATAPDEKLLVFFAGHGHTATGKRGEIGFLVPVDGKPNDTSTLIPWTELTRTAELIRAKHVLFIMDACYGGLALTRGAARGTARFLGNMCERYARQVLTAGKADEPVSDAGGPVPEHSVFTGHLLQGLMGGAAKENGIVTANGLMAYVYEKVGSDQDSHQTPHYGFIDGDGDFIFTEELLQKGGGGAEKSDDIMVSIPIMMPEAHGASLADQAKQYIADPAQRIMLHDLVVNRVKDFLEKTDKSRFAVNGQVNVEVFKDRLARYEEATHDILTIMILLSRWGNAEHMALVDKTLRLATGMNHGDSGDQLLLNLRWYPCNLLVYAGGIAALEAGNYDCLAKILTTSVTCRIYNSMPPNIAVQMTDGMTSIDDWFKHLPGHERNYVPRSEYLSSILQPELDQQLYLGGSYETLFDRLEMFLAFVYADVTGTGWGPLGRFAYKRGRRFGGQDMLIQLVDEGKTQRLAWGPLKAGLFGGSFERFEKATSDILKTVSGSNWR